MNNRTTALADSRPSSTQPDELIDWAYAAESELRRLVAENAYLKTGYDASRLEVESLKARVDEVGRMARENRSRAVVELEQQLEKEINARKQAQIENEQLKERIARGDIKHEKMQLEAKVAGLQAMLTKANNQAEHFERHWYLCSDAIEGLQARVQELEAMLDAVGAGGVEPLRKRHNRIVADNKTIGAPSRWLTTI